MSNLDGIELYRELPDGCCAVDIDAAPPGSPVRICAIVRRIADPVAGHLLTLAERTDARMILGGLIDARGRCQQWLEICVQNVRSMPGGVRYAHTNAACDARWEQFKIASDTSDLLLATGWESGHSSPCFLDPTRMAAAWPRDADGALFRICRDDTLLARRNLPLYSTGTQRFLYLPERGDDTPIVALSDDPPPDVQPLTRVLPEAHTWIAFNPAGAFLLVRRRLAWSFESAIDTLAGAPPQPTAHGRTTIAATPALSAETSGFLFIGPGGHAGRLQESWHLRLQLLSGVFDSVRRTVRGLGRPLLGLTAASFRVDAPTMLHARPAPPALPYWWTAAASLIESGAALPLSLPQEMETQYLCVADAGIYQPDFVSVPCETSCVVRLRQVGSENGALTVHATFSTDQRLQCRRGDLVCLSLPLASGEIDLIGHAEPDSALAAGEWRFVSKPVRAGAHAATLSAAEGMAFGTVPLRLIPHHGVFSDLFALGVLSVRALLVNDQNTLPIALDELRSLARQVTTAGQSHEGQPLDRRIRSLMQADARWDKALGPHRLARDEARRAAATAIPVEWWARTLAFLVRMFPESRSEGFYRNTPSGTPHRVFDPPHDEMRQLLAASRCLLTTDWVHSREIYQVIQHQLHAVASPAKPIPTASSARSQ